MEAVRIGTVGLGRAGMGMHLPEFAGKEEYIRVVAVCDILEDRRLQAANKLGCKSYASIEELIADPEVEVVDIATRSCDHFRHAKMALEAGKSVMLEKPMCCQYQDAKWLVDYATSHPEVKLYVRHNRRWEPKFQQVSEIIASGLLGKVFEIRLARNSFGTRNDWQTLSEFGGGQMLNWGPHIVDHALRFCGGDYTKLFSETKQINASGDCEDHIKIVMEGINGVTVDLEISSGVALDMPEYIVYGDRGSLIDAGGTLRLHYIKPGQNVVKLPADPGTPGQTFGSVPDQIEWIDEEVQVRPESLDQMWIAMAKDFRLGIPYPIHLDEALKVIQTIDEAKKA